jgi:hypothetical protein
MEKYTDFLICRIFLLRQKFPRFHNLNKIPSLKSIPISLSKCPFLPTNLTRKLRNLNCKYSKCLAKVNDLEVEIQKQSHDRKIIIKISEDAENSDQKALLLMDLINNYIYKKVTSLD